MNGNQIETNITKSIKKQNGEVIQDERQRLYNMSALTCGLVAGLILDIVMIFYHFFTRNIKELLGNKLNNLDATAGILTYFKVL